MAPTAVAPLVQVCELVSTDIPACAEIPLSGCSMDIPSGAITGRAQEDRIKKKPKENKNKDTWLQQHGK